MFEFKEGNIIATKFACQIIFSKLFDLPLKDYFFLYHGSTIEDKNIINLDSTILSGKEVTKDIIDNSYLALISLIASNCVERYFENNKPDLPPKMEIYSDGYYCYQLLSKLREYLGLPYNEVTFIKIYYDLLEHVSSRVLSNKAFLEDISLISVELLNHKFGVIHTNQIIRLYTYAKFRRKMLLQNKNQLHFDLKSIENLVTNIDY